jgi:homocysteine S-methyltransferase
MLPSQEYTGKYDPEHLTRQGLREWHRRRIEPFFVPDCVEERARVDEVWMNVDMIAFETLPLVQEVLAVREVVSI